MAEPAWTGLLDDARLEASAVVANCAMNRERQLAGVNSYTRELGFSPVDVMTAILGGPHTADVAWLDLCCGSGRALIQAAGQLRLSGLAQRAALVGVDLAAVFDPIPSAATGVELVCASVTSWEPSRKFDLITCVHGLHYVGDKLGTLVKAASWLTHAGQFVADLDLSGVRRTDGRPAGRALSAQLRAAGFTCDLRRHRISCTGQRDVQLPYTYLGADDRTGANYTGQPAVCSYYVTSP